MNFRQLLRVTVFTVSLVALQASGAELGPSVNCKSSWQGKDVYKYNFSLDTRGQRGLKGNFGYQNYLNRIEANPNLKIKRSDCKKEWTILVFMSVSEDLKPYAFWDLYEMEAAYSQARAGSTVRTDLVVEMHGDGTEDFRRLHIFQTQTPYSRSKNEKDFKEHDLGEVLSPVAFYKKKTLVNKEEQLFNFIKWGVKKYPAENYMVVVWGHGQGYAGYGGSGSGSKSAVFSGRFEGRAFQDSSKTFLTTPALARVFKKVHEVVFAGKDKIDVYASDACLMQMAEVAYEVAPYTKYIVGSAQIQSYLGLPYRRMLYEINHGRYNRGLQKRQRSCGDDKACYVARMLPDLFLESFSKRGLQSRDNKSLHHATMSALSSAAIDQFLLNRMNTFSSAMLTALKVAKLQDRIKLSKLLGETLTFPGENRELSVFLEMLKLFIDEKPIGTRTLEWKLLRFEVIRFQTWLTQASLAWSYGDRYQSSGYAFLGFKGISVWIPRDVDGYQGHIDDFRASRLYQSLQKDKAKQISLWELWIRQVLGIAN